MKAAPEIKSYVENIRYYEQQIRAALDAAFGADVQEFTETIENSTILGNKVNEYSLFGNTFVNVTGQIGASCQMILRACQNIERQVQIAEGKKQAVG